MELDPSSMPDGVIAHILHSLVASGARPGDAIRLACVCRSLHAAVYAAEVFWRLQCGVVGFRQLYEGSAGPAAWEPLEPPGGSWSGYYCARMLQRYRIRGLMRKYIVFLPAVSARAMRPGAMLTELQRCEVRMGTRLPWQAWELLRHRDGQLITQGAAFAYEGRLLSVEEAAFLYIQENKPDTSHIRQGTGDEPFVPLTTEFAGRRQFMYDVRPHAPEDRCADGDGG